MPPKYVVVMHSDEGVTSGLELDVDDDVAALVNARRLFMHELLVTAERPLAVQLGRHRRDGLVDWMSVWRSPTAQAAFGRSVAPRSSRAAPKTAKRTRARQARRPVGEG